MCLAIGIIPKAFCYTQQTVCRHIYFIIKGAIRFFYLKDGKDITALITLELGVIAASDRFILNRPSRNSLEVVEGTSVLSMTRGKMEGYLKRHQRHVHSDRLFVE
jgi:hypothetical protein